MRQVAIAAEALGWVGQPVAIEFRGRTLVVLATEDPVEAARRWADGTGPVVDPWMLQCRADLDERFLSRPAPVHITGALALRRTWAAASESAGPFSAFGMRAAVVPAAVVSSAARAEVGVTGLGVVAITDGIAEVLAWPDTTPPAHRTRVHRLVEEQVWAALIAAQPTPARRTTAVC